MSSKPLWMVRAGRGSRFIDDFLDQGFVGIGSYDLSSFPIDSSTDKAELVRHLLGLEPGESEGTMNTWASQILRYCRDLAVGDGVTTYDPGRRLYYLGTIQSEVVSVEHEKNLGRRVSWEKKVHRDLLSPSTRNSLGAIQTLFLVPGTAAAEMRRLAIPTDEKVQPPTPGPLVASEEEGLDEKSQLDEVVSKAQDFVEDRISRLSWDDMQELVAGILDAMGYRASVAARGPDRGVDIFASPDGLGLEEPRIFVEVKHRPGTSIGAPDIRSFLGGRRPGDRCLYVSTGGFTREARYEADRASVPVTLLTLPGLRELLVEHYEELDPAVAGLVRLEKIYWPVG